MNARSLAFLLIILGMAGSTAAQEQRFTAGVRGAYDVIPDSGGTVRFPSGEVFLRAAFSPTLAVEGSYGKRQYSYVRNGGYSWEKYSMDQNPIFLGLVYMASPGEVFRPTLGGGLAVVPTSFESSDYSYYSSPALKNTSGSTTEVIPWAGIGVSVHFRGSPAMLDFGARYVFGSDTSYAADSPSQRYIRLQLGVGYRF
jgi:hypothetical protein